MPDHLPEDIAREQRENAGRLVPAEGETGHVLTVTGRLPFKYAFRQGPDEEIPRYPGSPDGELSAPIDSLVRNTVDHTVWINTDGDTAWTEISDSGGATFPISFNNGTTTYTIEIDGTDFVMKVVTNAGSVQEARFALEADGDMRLDNEGAISIFNSGADDVTIASDQDFYLEADRNMFIESADELHIDANVLLKLAANLIHIDGPNVFTNRSVISSGSLDPGDFDLWLDDTPGATKLMIKAKDSGGTVRTGSIALT